MVMIPLTLGIVISATILDIKSNRIPNFVTLPVIVLGLIVNTYFFGFQGLAEGLAGIFVGTLLLMIPFAMGGMGGGDVKLLAGIGALNGVNFVFHAFLYSALTGGVISVIILLSRGLLGVTIRNILQVLTRIPRAIANESDQSSTASRIKFPYGIAIFIGTITTIWLR